MKLQHRMLRIAAAIGVLAAAGIVGIRETHQTALAKSPLAPPGCPAVSKGNFTGLLAQSSDLKIQAASGLPPNSVELLSFHWGVGRGISSPTGASSDRWGIGRGISSPTGGSADREASAPSVSEIVVTKASDVNDPLIIQEASQGAAHAWTLWLYRTAGPNGAPACESLALDKVFISGYSLSSGGDRPQESLSFNFAKVTVTNFGNGTSYVLSTPSTQ